MIPPTDELYLEVSVERQEVALKKEDQRIRCYAVSTSMNGLGEEEGSYKTPRGWFCIEEKIGEGSPLGTLFKSRVATGKIWTPHDPLMDEDLILTRILWLKGLEPLNQNTQQRYIYFHGTNHETSIGKPASHGCIRMRNEEIIQLFDCVNVGTKVYIG